MNKALALPALVFFTKIWDNLQSNSYLWNFSGLDFCRFVSVLELRKLLPFLSSSHIFKTRFLLCYLILLHLSGTMCAVIGYRPLNFMVSFLAWFNFQEIDKHLTNLVFLNFTVSSWQVIFLLQFINKLK